MKDTSVDMSYLLEVKPTHEDLAVDHALDISASVCLRLKELDLTQRDLAEKLGVDKSWVSRIIHGYPGMSLKTLAKLELALDMDLASGFVYRPQLKKNPDPVSYSGFELVDPSETGCGQVDAVWRPQEERINLA